MASAGDDGYVKVFSVFLVSISVKKKEKKERQSNHQYVFDCLQKDMGPESWPTFVRVAGTHGRSHGGRVPPARVLTGIGGS